MINEIMLYWSHLKSSKKTIFISTIGLIFAIAILSSSIVYIDARKTDITNELASPTQSPYGISIDIKTQDINTSFNKVYTGLNSVGNKLIEEDQINFLNPLELFYSIQGLQVPAYTYTFTYPNGYPVLSKVFSKRSLTIVELNNGIKQDLQPYLNATSTLPTSPDPNASVISGFLLSTYFGPSTDPELQAINNNTLENYITNPMTNVIQYTSNETGSQIKIIPLKVTGYGKLVNFNIYSLSANNYVTNYNESQFPTLSKLFKITPNTDMSYLFVQNISVTLSKFSPIYYDKVQNQSIYGITENINGGYSVNYNKIDPLSLIPKIDQLSSLTTILRNHVIISNFFQSLDQSTTSLNINFVEYNKLITISDLSYEILYQMVLYATPMFLVALLVTNFSFGLIQKKFHNHIGIYKTRGANVQIIFIFQVLDYGIIVIIASILGMFSGIPVNVLATKTNGLMSFTNPTNYDVLSSFLTVLPFLFEVSFLFSILLSLIVNLRRMITLSRMTINESEQAVDKGEPFWKIHYFDFIIFLYGLIGYLIVNYFLYSPYNTAIASVGSLFLIVFAPTPFAIGIGTILIANRIIPYILQKIGTNLWTYSGGLFAFSFKNVIRHKQSSTRAIILITTLITFLILFYTVPASQINYERLTSEYTLGADAQLVIPNSFTQRFHVQSFLDSSVQSIQDKYGSYLTGMTLELNVGYHSDSDNVNFNFLFINSTSYLNGSSVSLFDLGLSNSLQHDLQQLHNFSLTNPILVQRSFLSFKNLHIGQQATLDLLGQSSAFNIVDAFSQWPQTTRNALDFSTFYFIIDLNYFYNQILPNIVSSPYFHSFTGFILLNFKNPDKIHEIAPQISLYSGFQANEANTNLNWWEQDLQLIYKFQLGQINIDLIASSVITITILLMFAYMQLIERRQEIFTERTLGMKLRQMVVIFYNELLILLVTSLVLASILSIFFIDTFSVFITGGLSIPRYEVLVPFDLIEWTYALLIVLASFCSFVPAYYLSKQDIIRNFSAES